MSLSQIGFVHAQRPSESQHENRNQGRPDTQLSERSKTQSVSVWLEGARITRPEDEIPLHTILFTSEQR
ncbi:MAG: hypothetical protein QF735_07960, partial [Phycisphaeraceae bacterium]|nr:hypothetical protein [Phycisphaeraceae bacterium]